MYTNFINYFSKKAGFSSPSWLKFIISGQRNLSAEGIEKFISALKFGKKEAAYFRALVNFNQAKSESLKNKYFKELVQASAGNDFRKVDEKQYEFYSTWEMLAADTYRACGLDVSYEVPPEGLQGTAITPISTGLKPDRFTGITLSPNPFTTMTTIGFQKKLPLSRAIVYIYNTQGEEIRKLELNDGAETIWNAAGLPGGVYLVRVNLAGQSFRQKVMVQPQGR